MSVLIKPHDSTATNTAIISSQIASSLQCTADNLLLHDVPDREELKKKILARIKALPKN